MKKITIIFMSVLMIFASCSMNTSYDNSNEIEEKTNTEKEDDSENNKDEPSNEEPKEDDSENNEDEHFNEDGFENNEDEPLNEEPKEDDSENNENEHFNEDDSENKVVEDKTWCEISEDTKILGLNYFVCINNSQTKLNPSTNNESQAKKDTFLIRGYASRYVEIRVEYNNKKLNFSSVSDSYTITDVMKKDSTINITIEWK